MPSKSVRIARGRQVTRPDLIASLDAARGNSNLSSAVRVFILDYYRAMAGQSNVSFTPMGVIPRAAVIVNPTCDGSHQSPPGWRFTARARLRIMKRPASPR
jgi:hypothetical protein